MTKDEENRHSKFSVMTAFFVRSSLQTPKESSFFEETAT